MYDLNLETGAVMLSPEYASMVGHDPQTFQETYASWRGRLHPDERVAVLTILDDYFAGRLVEYRVEFRLRTHDGQWKWIHSMDKLHGWATDGRPLRMLGTHTDIDALKAADAALRKVNASLEARVDEHTAELTAANRELETFSHTVSQDLRAPLRAMSAFSHALREEFGECLAGTAKAYLVQIAWPLKK